MIIVDIETTGLNPKQHDMLSIGAVDYNTGKEFYGECTVYPETVIDPIAMDINGFSLDEIYPQNQSLYTNADGYLIKKVPAVALYWEFCIWCQQFPDKLLAGHNVGHLDMLFLEEYHSRLWGSDAAKFPFGYRTIDLHSVAFARLGKSLSHSDICRELGLTPEPKPHNALMGARSERDAFKILLPHNVKSWASLRLLKELVNEVEKDDGAHVSKESIWFKRASMLLDTMPRGLENFGAMYGKQPSPHIDTSLKVTGEFYYGVNSLGSIVTKAMPKSEAEAWIKSGVYAGAGLKPMWVGVKRPNDTRCETCEESD